MSVFRMSEKSLSTVINRMVIVNKKEFSNMRVGTQLSFRKISPSLPQTVDTASQRRKAAYVLLSTGTSQDEKLLIKVCLREIVIKEKKIEEKLKDRELQKYCWSNDTCHCKWEKMVCCL